MPEEDEFDDISLLLDYHSRMDTYRLTSGKHVPRCWREELESLSAEANELQERENIDA